MRRFVVFYVLASCGRLNFTDVGDAGGTDVPVGTAAVAPLYPMNGSSWNSYVDNALGGGTAATRPDAACTSNGRYFTCLHAGELRAFPATGLASCAGLTAADALGAFRWTCDGTTNPVTFYSTGLLPGKGLRDLVDASGWLANHVVVSNNGQPVLQTPSSVWWNNPVVPLPRNQLATDAPIALDQPGTVYTLAADDTSSGYDLSTPAANGISIVTLGSAVLTYSGAMAWCGSPSGTIGGSNALGALICAGDVSDVWIEARLRGGNAPIDNAIFFGDGVDFARVHRSELDGNGQVTNGITMTTTSGSATSFSNMVDWSTAHDNTGVGFNTLLQSTADTIMHSSASHNGQQGFWLGAHSNGSLKVMYDDIATDNGAAGADIDLFDEQFSVVQLTSFNNAQEGVRMEGNYGNYVAVTSVLNGGYAFSYPSAGNPFSETFTNLALVAPEHVTECLYLQSNNALTVTDVLAAHCTVGIDAIEQRATFGGAILIGDDQIACSNAGSNATLDNTCNHGSGLAIAPVTGIEPASSFVGTLAAGDPANPTPQASGRAAYPPNDWTTFGTPFRGWGKGGAAVFAAALAGACGSGDECQIYDWSLVPSDPVLRNFNGAFPTNGGACPASVDASKAANVIVNYDTPPLHFLRAAVEVMDPWLNPNGNYNGLCESNEACIYLPNLGAYQGSGDFTTQTCGPFLGGNGVVDVTLYAYPNN